MLKYFENTAHFLDYAPELEHDIDIMMNHASVERLCERIRESWENERHIGLASEGVEFIYDTNTGKWEYRIAYNALGTRFKVTSFGK